MPEQGQSERWASVLLQAQADLQTGLGMYRLEHGRGDVIEDYLARSLARCHSLLAEMGRPMYDPATHPDVSVGADHELTPRGRA